MSARWFEVLQPSNVALDKHRQKVYSVYVIAPEPALRSARRPFGAEYVLLNSPGGLPSLRRFAQEVMPAFAGVPRLQSTV